MIAYDPTREALYTGERRPTLFVAGQAPPLQVLAMEAARLAYLRAERHDDQRARLHEALGRVGFGAPALLADEATGTFGYASVRAADGARLVALRGTQPDDLRDLITDLRFPPVAWPESAGQVHQGFALAARGVLPQLRGWLAGAGLGAGPLVLCGHSLGAAVATLAASVLRPALLVTLGSPRVGDAAFADSVAGLAGCRLVDGADIVTRLPPEALGYVHVRPPTYITAAGEVLDNPSPTLIAADCAQAEAGYLLQYALQPGNVALRSLADHAPINYLRAFYR